MQEQSQEHYQESIKIENLQLMLYILNEFEMLYKEKFVCNSSQGDFKSLFSGYRTLCLKFHISRRIILLCQRNLDSMYLLLYLKLQTIFLAIQKNFSSSTVNNKWYTFSNRI
jgi:hypothetical protein